MDKRSAAWAATPKISLEACRMLRSTLDRTTDKWLMIAIVALEKRSSVLQ
jgi:hypothetical protein